MSDNTREPMVGQVPRPAGVSPMKNNQEQGQRRSNPGRGQLESTRRSIKNALYTMRDVMQDDDMAENMQNSFQVIINTTSHTRLDHYTQYDTCYIPDLLEPKVEAKSTKSVKPKNAETEKIKSVLISVLRGC